jgi:plastocyanin
VRVKTRLSLLGVGLALALGVPHLRADDKTAEAGVEDLRKEVKQLKAQLQAIRSALQEAAELDRQRAALFGKALKVSAGSETSAPVQVEASERTVTRPGSGAPSLPRKREVAVATGTLRGKVKLPPGEPVAYVYVENVFAPEVKGDKVVIEQVRKQFVPPWAVIQRGTTVEFPNLDNIYHNVFSLSSGNSFDLGLYNSSGQARTHTFSEPGSVEIYCNIHPQMSASILVVPNRHFAKVKPDGSFEIADVPTGKRKVVAWSPGSRLNVQWAQVDAGDPVEVAFQLEPKSTVHRNKNNQLYGSYQ